MKHIKPASRVKPAQIWFTLEGMLLQKLLRGWFPGGNTDDNDYIPPTQKAM